VKFEALVELSREAKGLIPRSLLWNLFPKLALGFIPVIPVPTFLTPILVLTTQFSVATNASPYLNPAVGNLPASAGGGMRCNMREVALSSALQDNSSSKFQCATLLKFAGRIIIGSLRLLPEGAPLLNIFL
jgi:hypothetical protein